MKTNAFAVEKAYGLPVDAVRSILRGGKKSGTALNRAQEVCQALGLEFYIGPPRETEPVELLTVGGADYAHIPLHDAYLSAGAGAMNEAEQVVDSLAFRRDWLQKVGVAASAAKLARVKGDSMQPCLWDGDMMLINTSLNDPPVRQREARDQRRLPVYAFLDGGEARVKRIERPTPDQLLLISDNSEYPPELRQGDDLKVITIIGKVVWWGHTNKD